MKQLINAVGAIALVAAILGCAVLVVLASTFTYPWFSGDMVNSAHLSTQQITENYRAVIAYCLLPWVDEFTIPHLPFSAAGAQHFVEAKALFQGFIAAGLVGAVVSGLLLWRNWRRRRAWGGWIVGGAAIIVTIVTLGLIFLIDFDRAFVVFHEIAFGVPLLAVALDGLDRRDDRRLVAAGLLLLLVLLLLDGVTSVQCPVLGSSLRVRSSRVRRFRIGSNT